MLRILIADDENIILEPINDYFVSKGLSAVCAKNGQEALELAENSDFDLIILDVMMPVTDGLEACRQIRKFTDVPILFLSALGEEQDLLSGYKNGCDDYIVKPFPLSVLYEKVLSMIKRYKKINTDNRITAGGVSLDLIAGKVFVKDTEIKLGSRDFRLLSYLIENKGILLSRELILTKIWGYDYDGDIRVVDTHIKRIRQKLGNDAGIIKTVFGVGYTIEEE